MSCSSKIKSLGHAVTTNPITNLAEIFLQAGERWSSRPAFATRDHDGTFQSVSYRAWCDRSLALATALIERGVNVRDHVGLLSDNSLSWIVANAAVQFCGAADVPRGSDITSSEMTYIINHADIKILFLENGMLLEKLRSVIHQLPQLSQVIMMQPFADQTAGNFSKESESNNVNGYHFDLLSLNELEEHGQQLRLSGDRRVEERIQQIQSDDLFTIIYTSGTTGVPKGVQLTHAAICSQIKNLPLDFSEQERALSILPIWHSYERVFEMVMISHGGCTYYTSPRHLSSDFQRVKPTLMASAPRLWEALYERIAGGMAKQGFVKKYLFKAALICAHAVRGAKRFFKGQELDVKGRFLVYSIGLALLHSLKALVLLLPFLLLDRIILKKIRNIVGGSLKATISGGGALPPYIDTFFNDCGIPVLEGYGLTESCPVLAVRTPEQLVLGTVGSPLPETEIRIVDLTTGKTLYPDKTRSDLGRGLSGEICARGPQIMKGYYKDPEGTAKVLHDGWLRTGDIGLMTFNLKTAMDHGKLTQYAQPQNNFSKPSRTHWVCHGLWKIIFRLSSYLNFLIDSLAPARLTLRVACGNLTQPVTQASVPITVFRFNGCLKIIGRCKETIVLLNGENVEPQPIESRLLESPLIEQCIVVGQDQKQLGVLIVPSLSGLAAHGFASASLSELLHNQEKLKPLFQAEIRRLVSNEHGFKAFEKIGYWRLLEKPFEVGSELTATYKLKRHVIAEQYKTLLCELFKSNKEE